MDPWLVVGLGNPGPKYAGNRHNIGAMVIADLAQQAGASAKEHKARAWVSEIRLGTMPGGAPGPRAILAQPMTYMNVSGGPVAGLARFYKVPLEQIIVIHDELDIDFGVLRLKRGGGEGGHNGLRSISQSLGTKDYLRVRLGIGRPPAVRIPRTMCSPISPPAIRSRSSCSSATGWTRSPNSSTPGLRQRSSVSTAAESLRYRSGPER